MARRILVALFVVFFASHAAAQQGKEKVSVCHFSGKDAQLLSISPNALQAHLAHGDVQAPPSVRTAADCLIPQAPPEPVATTATTSSAGTASFVIPNTNVMARVTTTDAKGSPVSGATVQVMVIGDDYMMIAATPDGRLAPAFAEGKLSEARAGSALSLLKTLVMHAYKTGFASGGLQLTNLNFPMFMTTHFATNDRCFTEDEFQSHVAASCSTVMAFGLMAIPLGGGALPGLAKALVAVGTTDECGKGAQHLAAAMYAGKTLPIRMRIYGPPQILGMQLFPFYFEDLGSCGGGCCVANGPQCQLASSAQKCNGQYRDNTPCSADLCKTGACCDPNGGCAVTSELDCNDRGWTYRGDNVPCTPDPCKSGACCDPATGDCSVKTEFVCKGLGGIYQGDDTTCSPGNPCRKGACCEAGGCSVQTEFECGNRGGKYQGDKTTCSPDPCNKGACCDPRTGCVVVSDIECASRGGSFHGRDTTCERISSATPVRVTLQSGGGVGGASFPIPFTHGTIRTKVTIPGNIVNGQCQRDWRVEIFVHPFNAGRSGGMWIAGQQFSICHANPETITMQQLNPGTPCSTYSVNALTAGVSTVEVEIIP